MKMNPYQLLRRAAALRSPRLRFLGAWVLYATGRRYVGVFLDPVLACNLRCQMCYFSDEKRRKELSGKLSEEELERIADIAFPKTLKLQIGCGAEPTLYKGLPQLIALGKQHQVPYISITTNGQLITQDMMEDLLMAGLDEITLSLHGLTKETYEKLMPGASWSRFEELVGLLAAMKKAHDGLNIRLNYTMNSCNTDELRLLPSLLERLPANVVQLRPVQRIGNSQWQDFSTDYIEQRYADLLTPLAATLKQRGVTLLMPSLKDLRDLSSNPSNCERALQELTYCNIDPQSAPTFAMPGIGFWKMLKILCSRNGSQGSNHDVTKKLAYQIQ